MKAKHLIIGGVVFVVALSVFALVVIRGTPKPDSEPEVPLVEIKSADPVSIQPLENQADTDASVAQRRRSGFVNHRLGVQIPPLAPIKPALSPEPDTALAVSEMVPITLEQAIKRTKLEYNNLITLVNMEEQERYLSIARPTLEKFKYPDKFSAVMRNEDGVQLTTAIWEGGRYIGGSTAAGLNKLTAQGKKLPGLEARLVDKRQRVSAAQYNYKKERIRLINARTKRTARGLSSPDVNNQLRGLSSQIEKLRGEVGQLGQTINNIYKELKFWERLEESYRYKESLKLIQLVKERDLRVRNRIMSAVGKEPRYAIIARCGSLEEGISSLDRIINSLVENGLDEAAEQKRKRLEEMEEELRQLITRFEQEVLPIMVQDTSGVERGLL